MRPELLFVSTRFLFPTDSGGKIRTTQVLRGMKDGHFRIHLISPATAEQEKMHADKLGLVCDEFTGWPAPRRGGLFRLLRARHLADSLPIPVRTDSYGAARHAVVKAMGRRPAVSVFDFLHAAVLAPLDIGGPSVLFTHNVEAEIFARHADVAKTRIMRAMWRSQYAKMCRFEADSVSRFDVLVAVSQRDSEHFARRYGVADPFVIPTGVDLDFFEWQPPTRDNEVVFCGSMDWLANQEAIEYFMDEVWEKIAEAVPKARMTVVGRAPPERLVAKAARRGLPWTFTGFVDDVRPYVRDSSVSVIPLRVGGGTRLKVFEAMAMGSPIVSTSLGVEGLPVTPGLHYLQANDNVQFAEGVVRLLRDPTRRASMARASRQLVESRFSYRTAAGAFEKACMHAMQIYGKGSV